MGVRPTIVTVLVMVLTQGKDTDGQQVVESGWTVHSGLNASSYHKVLTTRSKMDCGVSCGADSDCWAFAFESLSGTCYLYPYMRPGNAGTSAIEIYEFTVPCPLFTVGNGDITWRRDMTSLVGDVTCVMSHIWPHEDAVVRCVSGGIWSPSDTQCLRHQWTDPELTGFAIPRPVQVGWKTCMTGTPTAGDVFIIGIADELGDPIFEAHFIFDAWNYVNTIRAFVDQPEHFVELMSGFQFPLTVGALFNIEISVISADNTFELKVNGVSQGSLTSAQPLGAADAVYYALSVNISFMDVWCAQ